MNTSAFPSLMKCFSATLSKYPRSQMTTYTYETHFETQAAFLVIYERRFTDGVPEMFPTDGITTSAQATVCTVHHSTAVA